MVEIPTAENIGEWDDASLFSSVGFHAITRCDKAGFDSLNEAEVVIGSLFHFVGEVNSGGFGQWLAASDPGLLLGTIESLKKIGAVEMAGFIADILGDIGDIRSFVSLEHHSDTYLVLEPETLERIYAYTREHWREVRRSD